MEDDEKNKYLRDIATRTARIDERTNHISNELQSLRENDARHDERLDSLDSRVQRNTMITSGVLFSLGSAITAIFAKLGGLIRW
ncbi:emp24/gp25L/p24 family protein [Halorubellus litoreus]|uniref:Emp24/gp25L/p24 family protein n=1 Tax=Halorubellus litoreus TaxID=755308 RepID=A0ABD5VIJ2_9EURY